MMFIYKYTTYINIQGLLYITLNTATMLFNLLVLSNFFVDAQSIYTIKLSVNKDNLSTIFHLIIMPLISFSYFIPLATTFSKMLNRSGESVHHCLVSNLSQKKLKFQK